MMEQEGLTKQKGLQNRNFTYLDLFEQQIAEHKKAEEEFYMVKAKEDSENDAKKPAFFQKNPEKNVQMTEN